MSLEDANFSSVIEDLSSSVRSHSKSGIVHCLNRIRNEPRILDKLMRYEGFDVLIKLLRFQNSKILDTTLSILANAFLKPSVREEVRGGTISTNVIWIIKNLNSGPTLHCRACRLIGNMAESRRHAKALCDAGVIAALAGIFDTKPNVQTLSMTVRALRNIWDMNENSHDEILERSIIRIVMNLLINSSKKLQEDGTLSKYKQLQETCLKAVKYFANSTDIRLSDQIRGKENLIGYTCIIELCKSNNRMAFQILYKLSQTANHRPDLGSTRAIECLINFLKTKKNVDSSSSGINYEAISSLCLFSREAVNRAKIRDFNGLQLMLMFLDDSTYESYHSLLLHALTQFVCDAESMSIMIKNGIVSVLANQLKKMAVDVQLETSSDSGSIIEVGVCSRKRSAETMSSPHSSPPGESKYNRTGNGRFSLDYYSSQWSPCSANSSSPSTSPSLPSNANDTKPGKDEDDNYSPVCSDSEEWVDNEESKSTTAQEHDEIESLNSYISSHVGEDKMDVSNHNESEVNKSHMWTLVLFTRLTFWNDPIDGLADPTTIQALTAYIDASKNIKAPSILNRIINNHVYFLPLLLQGFVFEAQLLDHPQEYLKILCGVADSGGAFGELASTLLRGPESDKFMVAVSVPFLLKSKDKLRTLLNTYGGLELIFKLLADQEHLLNENSVLSICQLAETLGVIPATIEQKPSDSKSMQVVKTNDGPLHTQNIVTFELDDGGTVDACRQLLCRKSEFFSAMLEGKFYEAGQRHVRLQNVSKGGLSTLCLAASGRLFNHDNLEDVEPTIESLLDAVLLADQFLMSVESEKLTEMSIEKLTGGNLIRAWNWARSNDCCELKTSCVKNFLTSQLSRVDRLCAFRDFSSDVNFQEFLNDVRTILAKGLLIRQ